MNRHFRRIMAVALSVTLVISGLPQAVAAAPGPRETGPVSADRSKGVAATAITTKKPVPDAFLAQEQQGPKTVRWPRATTESVAVGGGTSVGGLDVRAARITTGSPAAVQVRTLDRSSSQRAGVNGPLMVVTGSGDPVNLSVGYADVADTYGGDYGHRLHLVRLPRCAVTTPEVASCRTQTPLASTNDQRNRRVTAKADQAAAGGFVMALTSGGSSAQGDYKATQLAPSSTWTVGLTSGAFTWNYPIRAPETPGRLDPQIALGYSSQGVDGHVSTTNNQGSWVGDGFSYEPGYIERTYNSCVTDGHPTWPDQCWAFDNGTLMLAGHSGKLVKNADGSWRLSSDDGTRIVKTTGAVNGDDDGEYWKVSTVDGLTYYFGLNRVPGWTSGNEETNSVWTMPVYGDDTGEPCNPTSWCQQGRRFNLDYVVDTHGNVMTYYYKREINYYARNADLSVNGTPYDRGGYLARIDYGQRDGQVYSSPAPARVVFDNAERCLPGGSVTCAESELNASTAGSWPDVPSDLLCAANTHCTSSQVSPTFFTRKRLVKIQSEARSGTGWSPVETWSMDHVFYLNDDGSSTLWLKKISHAGVWGGSPITLPDVTLVGEQKANRVDMSTFGALVRRRMSTITTESGSQIVVTYEAADCTAGALPEAGTSVQRCFPSIYHQGSTNVYDWFHKYVVKNVAVNDLTGGNDPMVTAYEYVGGAGWRKTEPDGFSKPEDQTWSDWRGYGQVRERRGDAYSQWTRTDHFYLRGMSGGKKPDGSTPEVTVTDSAGTAYTDTNELSGQELETQTYDGSTLLNRSISQPWLNITRTQTETWGSVNAAMVRTAVTRDFTRLLPDGPQGTQRWRETRSSGQFDPVWGRSLQVDDEGDVAVTGDEKCSRTEYADNAGRFLYAFPTHTQTVSVRCSVQQPDLGTQLLSDERIGYDFKAVGAAPDAGIVTRKDVLDKYAASQVQYTTEAKTTAVDMYGRPTVIVDPNGYSTTTEYVDVNGLNTQIKNTNPLGHLTTTTYDPAFHQQTSIVDPNNDKTEFQYDALGRLLSVWLPNRNRTNGESPNLKFAYQVRNDKSTVVTTQTITNSGGYRTTYALYDGLLRLRQKQVPTEGGWLLSDVLSTGTGKTKRSTQPYLIASGTPGDVPLTVPTGSMQGYTTYAYDGADRSTIENYLIASQPKWSTLTAFAGDRVSVDPPHGATPSVTLSDAQGNMTEKWQYKGESPTGAADVTRYTYNAAGELVTMKDPLNNLWKYDYHQNGKRKSDTDPDSGQSTFTYDNAGHVTSVTDARGTKISTKYDELGRVVETWQGEVGTGTKLTTTKYDSIKKGLVYWTARHTPSGTFYVLNTQYDVLNRPLTTKFQIPSAAVGTELGKTYTFTTAYNLDGSVQSTSSPGEGGLPAETLLTSYDSFLRPSSLTSGTSLYASVPNTPSDKGYDGYGNLTKMEMFTGGTNKKVWQNWDYESGSGRMIRMRMTRESAGNDMDAAYGYDTAGNVTSIADTPASGPRDIQCFNYDSLRRLSEAWATDSTAADPCANGDAAASGVGGPGAYHEKWTVDAAGNRTSETEYGIAGASDIQRTYGYPAQGATAPNQPHMPTTVTQTGPGGTKTFEYKADAAGNTTCRPNATDSNQCRAAETGHQKLIWDAEGRLASSTPTGGQATTYVYDAGGNRLVRNEPGAATLYLPGLELKLDTATRQVTGTRYYTFAKRLVAVRNGSSSVNFPVLDTNGTASAMIDATTGAIKWQRTTPYGEGRGTAPSSWPSQQGFVGGVKDANGLTHLGAREYDPVMGRFVSDDPVTNAGDPQSVNGYSYADSNPATFSDPDGNCVTADESGECWRPDEPKSPGPSGPAEHCGSKSASACGPDKIVEPDSPILFTTIYPRGTVLVRFKNGAAFINGYMLPPGMPGTPEELAEAIDATGGVEGASLVELQAKTADRIAGLCFASYCKQNDSYGDWGRTVLDDAKYLQSQVPLEPHEENWWDHYGGVVVLLAGIAALTVCIAATAGVCGIVATGAALVTSGDALYRYSLVPNPTPQDRACLGTTLIFSALSAGRAVYLATKTTHAAMTATQEMAHAATHVAVEHADFAVHLGLHFCEMSVSYH